MTMNDRWNHITAEDKVRRLWDINMRLTDWELRFISSILEVLAKDWELTDKQEDKVQEIYATYFLGAKCGLHSTVQRSTLTNDEEHL